MSPGDVVRIGGSGTVENHVHIGKVGLVIGIWTAPLYLGGDVYADVLVDGSKLCFYIEELQDIESEGDNLAAR